MTAPEPVTGLLCECGHDLDRHGWSGCWGSAGGTPPRVCDCRRKPSDVAAAAEARVRAEEQGDLGWLALEFKRRAEAAERRLAEVEGKVRALADETEGVGRAIGNDIVGRRWIVDRLRAALSSPEADPRPTGGCLHGPGARIGLCPNCGTVVDEAELARVKGADSG